MRAAVSVMSAVTAIVEPVDTSHYSEISNWNRNMQKKATHRDSSESCEGRDDKAAPALVLRRYRYTRNYTHASADAAMPFRQEH